MYLLSQEEFLIITDHQALKSAFQRKDINHRLARWMDLLAEYNFKIEHRAGKNNLPADYSSRNPLTLKDLCDTNDTELSCVVICKENIEEEMYAIFQFLNTVEMSNIDKTYRTWVRRNSKRFVVWNGILFRKTINGLRIVLDYEERKKALQNFHDNMGHWNLESTKQLILERYWWPKYHSNIYKYLQN